MNQSWKIPSTGRSPEFQVKQLGFNSVADFASSLPKDGTVADVGAGVSQLGHLVASLRPDITWVNIDPCYQDASLRTKLDARKPTNLILSSANILEEFVVPSQLKNGADLVYSYWLLPHLSTGSDTPARRAVGNMYDLLKPSGVMRVGPVRQVGFGLFSPLRYKGVTTHKKTQGAPVIIDQVVARTKLWWLPRFMQQISNTYNIHLGMWFVGGKTKSPN